MKGYEVLEKIEKGEIKEGTKLRIKHFDKEIIYEGRDTIKFIKKGKECEEVESCWFINTEIEVIEENKEIEELGEYLNSTAELDDRALAIENRIKINELVRAVNKINKEKRG